MTLLDQIAQGAADAIKLAVAKTVCNFQMPTGPVKLRIVKSFAGLPVGGEFEVTAEEAPGLISSGLCNTHSTIDAKERAEFVARWHAMKAWQAENPHLQK